MTKPTKQEAESYLFNDLLLSPTDIKYDPFREQYFAYYSDEDGNDCKKIYLDEYYAEYYPEILAEHNEEAYA